MSDEDHPKAGALSGEFDDEIAASKAARRSYRGAALGLPIAGPGSLGSFGERFWGLIIDSVLLIPFTLLLRPLVDTTRVEPQFVNGAMQGVVVSTGRPAWAAALVLLPRALYVIVAIGVFGRTLGQRASNLEVIARDGAAPGWLRAVRRWILIGAIDVVVLFAATFELGLLAYVVVFGSMLVSPNRQGLHDLFAGVVVVRTEPARR